MATPPSTYTGRVQQGAEDYDGSIIIIIIVGKVLHNALQLPVVVADCCLLWTIKRSSSSGMAEESTDRWWIVRRAFYVSRKRN